MALILAVLCASPSTTWAAKPAAGLVPTPARSPIAEEAAPRDVWWLAEAFAASRPNCDTMVGRGDSMLPLYRDRTVLVIERMEQAQLEPGMTVVFFGDSGRMVAHVLVERTWRGWIAQGVGNAERDRTLVRADNYLGTVIKAYTPNPEISSVRTPGVRVAAAGSGVGGRL